MGTKGRQPNTAPATALAVAGDGPGRDGGGGLHYFFRTPAPIRSATRANKVWPGLDVLGENSLVVAAPSLHHSGGSLPLGD